MVEYATLSVPHHLGGRRMITPKPSASHLAMQERGLELTVKERPQSSSRNDSLSTGSVLSIPSDLDKPLPLEPLDLSRRKRSSSMYSYGSSSSKVSLETTISHILDIYVDLPIKLEKCEAESPVQPRILQPKAYRDTIVPLLQHRFSMEQLLPSPPPVPQRSPLRGEQRHIAGQVAPSAIQLADHKKAPSYLEFTRHLRDRRNELTSPVSATSSDFRQPVPLDTLSEPSPLSPADIENKQATADGEDYFSRPIQNKETNDRKILAAPPGFSGDTLLAQIPKAETATQQVPADSLDGPGPTVCDAAQGPWPVRVDSTKGFVVQNGVADSVRAMIKDKMMQRRESKDHAKILEFASHKYPAMQTDQRERKFSWVEGRRSSIKQGVENVIRRLSMTTSSVAPRPPPPPATPTPMPRRREKEAAIPLTDYQKYGAELWLAKDRQQRKEEKKAQKEHERMQYQAHYLANTAKTEVHDHRRNVSEKSRGTADSQKNSRGFRHTLGGASKVLRTSAADKRREKLKESIVLVGPTQTTIERIERSGIQTDRIWM